MRKITIPITFEVDDPDNDFPEKVVAQFGVIAGTVITELIRKLQTGEMSFEESEEAVAEASEFMKLAFRAQQ